MEKQSKGSRGLEAYCKGGQGPPRAVAPSKMMKKKRRRRRRRRKRRRKRSCLKLAEFLFQKLNLEIQFSSVTIVGIYSYQWALST